MKRHETLVKGWRTNNNGRVNGRCCAVDKSCWKDNNGHVIGCRTQRDKSPVKNDRLDNVGRS